MSQNYITKENAEYVKNILNSVVKYGLEFKNNAKVIPSMLPRKEDYKISDEGMTSEMLVDFFAKKIMPSCSNFSNNGFMGFPDSGNSIAGIAGAFFGALLQQNLINASFCAPAATQLEMEVIRILRRVLGYQINECKSILDVGGIITYGGTGSNATAMLLARENRIQNTMERGVTDPKKFKVIIPKGIGHYSIRSSLKWIGCGDNVIEVKTKGFRYDIKELKRVLQSEKDNIMGVVAYAGDSRTMTIENLEVVVELVKGINSDIWCHVDACHGFSLAFSSSREKIRGIEKYDSISCDPHKVFSLPYCCSALLLKKPRNFKLIMSNSDLIMNEDFAFGQITPFIGSKSWISLKLWFVMKSFGLHGLRKMIDKRIEDAQYFLECLNRDQEFCVLNEVDFNSVVFIYKGNYGKEDIAKVNEINQKLYKRLKAEGFVYIHQFPLKDNLGRFGTSQKLFVLRYMSGNDNLKKEEIEKALAYIKLIAREIDGK